MARGIFFVQLGERLGNGNSNSQLLLANMGWVSLSLVHAVHVHSHKPRMVILKMQLYLFLGGLTTLGYSLLSLEGNIPKE